MTIPKIKPVAWTRPDCISSFITNARKVRDEYQADKHYNISLFTEAQLTEHGNERYEAGKSETHVSEDCKECLEAELAAAQLQIKTLIGALQTARNNAQSVMMVTSEKLHSYGALCNMFDCIDASLRKNATGDDSALQEHVSGVVERIAANFEYGACSAQESLKAIADKIRKGEFK